MNFFTADTHFSGSNIIKRDNRPYRNFIEMDEDIIAKFNSKISCEEDILWHLGDFFNYNGSDISSWTRGVYLVKELHCKVILIIGNNEERVIRDLFDNEFIYFREWCREIGFYDVMRDYIINIDGMPVYLNHYPSKHKNTMFNLFGHVHRNMLACRYGINVGCDLSHFYPYSEPEIIKLINDKHKYLSVDSNIIDMCESMCLGVIK